MLYDFHTHTFLSDGALSPLELLRRAHQAGYQAIALTDHVGVGHLERLIHEITRDCALAQERWGITAIPGVELTHVPASAISEVARTAKELGARLVAVHGETIVEPVEKGTNHAAAQSSWVDLLAHPGLLSLEDAQLAAANGIFIEITARRGHALCNGHVAHLARIAGAKLILDSDAHDEGDLLTSDFAHDIARGSGLESDDTTTLLEVNPRLLLKRLYG